MKTDITLSTISLLSTTTTIIFALSILQPTMAQTAKKTRATKPAGETAQKELKDLKDLKEQNKRKGSNMLEWPAVKNTMRPWTRWWWLGSAVDNKNLTYLLETYHKAGLGGVEITPIYGVQGQEAKDLPYLSPSWLNALRHTVAEAHRLDMGVDMPTGTGWPFGGPQVTEADTLDRMNLKTKFVPGGQPATLPAGISHPQALVAIRQDGTSISLLDKLQADGHIDWIAPPGGDWTLYAVEAKWSGMNVKRAAPGSAGPCINPFSRDSLLHYLARFDAALADLPKGSLRCHFHDSFEYQANWTAKLFEEFKARRGYDLRDHLPALNFDTKLEAVLDAKSDLKNEDVNEIEARVRTDYRETISDLLLENFTQTWTAWSHKQGSISRNQAHGSPGNLLDLYGAADIPETEVFKSRGDMRVSKFASSAAHLLGKPLVSSESCTWQSEHFTETLSYSKHILDRLLLAGINHIFYHGTAYSPQDAAWPGWLFYASTHFEPQNPTWREFATLNTYITRCQSLLQAGKPDNDILLYWPLHDLWQKRPKLFGLTIEGKWLESEPFGESAQSLWDRGYSFDYISDRQIKLATVDPNSHELNLPGGTYRTILVPPCSYMPIETFEHLLSLAHAGATVLFQNGFPKDVPGLQELHHRRDLLNTRLKELKQLHWVESNPDMRHLDYGKGKILVGTSANSLVAATHAIREPLVDHKGVMFVRRKVADGNHYLVVNQSDEPLDAWVALGCQARSVALMDPMTGRIGMGDIRHNGDTTEVYLQLQPGESVLLNTRQTATGVATAPNWPYIRNRGTAITLNGNWRVEAMVGGPTLPKPLSLSNLRLWANDAGAKAETSQKSNSDNSESEVRSEVRSKVRSKKGTIIGGVDVLVDTQDDEWTRFGGTARYTLTFNAPPVEATRWLLELDNVHESARVLLNGTNLGTLIAHPFRILYEGALKPEGNVLEIEVTNVAANRIRDMDRRQVKWQIFHEINFVNIDYHHFDASNWPIHPSGLGGPVRLIPLLQNKTEKSP